MVLYQGCGSITVVPDENVSGVSLKPLLIMLVMMVASGQIAQTIFVPALPMMGEQFSVSAGQLQAIMGTYLLAYGLLQFVYGPVSDRFGRKPLLLIGLSLFVIGAIIAACAESFNTLLLASAIQGCGTASAGALCRSIPRDFFFGEKLVRFNSYVSMAVVFSPLLAPFIGGVLSVHYGWHAVYWFLAFFGVCVVITLALRFKESLPKEKRQPQSMLKSYALVLKHRAFRGYLLSLVATFAGIAAFEAIAGILYGQVLAMSPMMVSCYFVAPIPGYLLGAWYAGRQASLHKLFHHGVALLGAGALFLLLPGLSTLVIGWSLLIGSVLFFTGAGILFPALTSAALEPFPRQAGVAGALLGGLQNFAAGLAAMLMSLVPMMGQLSIGLLTSSMVVLVVLALNYARTHPDIDVHTAGDPL
ncbi:multidrug efflux MFS transporter EmrD [Shewanella algae]|nr:multidrug transporter EmrD [Shewanella algae]NJI85329.1 multidrug efflux MFS transporter EmrD [Shewanella sp. Iso12]MBO2565220.1 multidrug efflux MFS transporter EmrD [Shewanella algae]MBO2569483.1 multidrug efflux MFS transporter EmrD [Shewanella algae]MBO2590947.1 multidrug efflux MFS transporter EmrD [Shewanella algae]